MEAIACDICYRVFHPEQMRSVVKNPQTYRDAFSMFVEGYRDFPWTIHGDIDPTTGRFRGGFSGQVNITPSFPESWKHLCRECERGVLDAIENMVLTFADGITARRAQRQAARVEKATSDS